MYRCLITALCLVVCVAVDAPAKPTQSTLNYLDESREQFPVTDFKQRDPQSLSIDSYEKKLPAQVVPSAKESVPAGPREVPAALPAPKPRTGGPQRAAPTLADTLTTQYVEESGLKQEGYAQPANPGAPGNPKMQYAYRYPELRASKNGLYVALFGGVTPLQNYQDAKVNLDPLVAGAGEFPYDTRSSLGPVGGVKVGYQFDPIPMGPGYEVGTPGLRPAIEVESMYLNFRSNGDIKPTMVVAPVKDIEGRHEVDMVNFSVNGILRFELGRYFHPYMGVGVGVAYLWGETEMEIDTTVAPYKARFSDEMNEFAFTSQGILGAEVRLTENWGIFTEYKFLYLPNLSMNDDSYEMNIEDLGLHLVTGGIRYTF